MKNKHYTYATIKILLNQISPLIRHFEQGKIDFYSSMPEKFQPIFIVCAARSGSTILYQTITNFLDLLYFDNLTNMFNHNIYFGFWLSNIIFKSNGHNNFRSNYGNTLSGGLRSPSEVGGFWDRWIPKNTVDFVSLESKSEIRKYIYSIMNRYEKSLIFKNIRVGQILPIIKDIFPNAKIIFIKRNPFFQAQSIYIAKKIFGMKRNDVFSIGPSNIEELKTLSEPDQIVQQIYYMEREIMKNSSLFPDDNFLIIDYEQFCDQSEEALDEIRIFLKCKFKMNKFQQKVIIEKSDIIRVEQKIADGIENAIRKLNWNYS